MHPSCAVRINLAAIASYFFIGIDAGICSEDAARAWAFAVIDALDHPPGEIIEISWNKPLRYLREDLKAVSGTADLDLVGRWLLGSIHASRSPDVDLAPLLRGALHIVNATGLGASLYNSIEFVEHELEHAETGFGGTVAEARASLYELLVDFRPPPFREGWADIVFEVHG